jgi:hypothetical protein
VTVVGAPPPSVNLGATGEPTSSSSAGAVIETVGSSVTVKLCVSSSLPATFDALTLSECGPGVKVFGPSGLVHGLIAASLSH